MATLSRVYASGEEGYKAVTADFAKMFDWDATDKSTSNDSNTFTDFKKNCGDDCYITLRVQSTTGYPETAMMFTNNSKTFSTNITDKLAYYSYVYGNGFFIFCASAGSMPVHTTIRKIIGISTCRNIKTGEIGWLSFSVNSTTSSNLIYSPYVFTKDSTDANKMTRWDVTKDAEIGGAVALHDAATGWVSDKIMLLTAIPDQYSACVSSVIFNGTPYTRVGHLLVPAT